MLTERRIKITNPNGLHARPATNFAKVASKFTSEIHVGSEGKETVSGKSVIDLLTLGAKNGTELLITAKGEDGKEALDAIENLIKGRFNEDIMEICNWN